MLQFNLERVRYSFRRYENSRVQILLAFSDLEVRARGLVKSLILFKDVCRLLVVLTSGVPIGLLGAKERCLVLTLIAIYSLAL